MDLSGRDLLPTYVEDATVTFSQKGILGKRDSTAYKLIDKVSEHDSD